MTDNQKLILNYIKAWARDHSIPVPLMVLRNALTAQMTASSFKLSILNLVIAGYLRETTRSNKKSYTLLKTK